MILLDLLIGPSLILIILFLVAPLIYALYCSFFSCDFMVFTKYRGLENYKVLLSNPDILKSIWRSFYVSGISLIIALILGILVALWIHQLKKSKLAFVLQLMVLIPWVTSMVVAAMLWKWIFQDDVGLVNFLLVQLSLKKIGFLSDPNVALYTLIFVMTWRVIGYVMVQILAGLKVIPEEYEEAAYADGANKWNLFWKIRLPLLKTPLAISAIIVGLSNINNLTVPLTLLAGGPGTSTMVISIELYRQGFTSYHFGEASALSILLCAINFILMVLYIKAVKYEV